jgi:hypothetical protein
VYQGIVKHDGAMVGINADVHGFCVHALHATAATNALAHNTDIAGYPFNAGQLEYECHYSKMHGMPVTGGRGFRGLKPL